tara:strand:- start:1108 stop:1704 length:597 start_codon:yes stop_codon:yes gene_type:complete
MSIENEDFIRVFGGACPEGFCTHLISEFERNLKLGAGTNRQNGEGALKHAKDDHQIFVNGRNFNFEDFNGNNTVDVFYHVLQKCYDQYASEFSVLRDCDLLCNSMKMQKTSSGGGYHVWHSEQGSKESASRGLVYALYLNTLPEGSNGETEFLYQQRRINPEENAMVFWPAAFTHPHRGNPVYGDTPKYIVTGWFYYG